LLAEELERFLQYIVAWEGESIQTAVQLGCLFMIMPTLMQHANEVLGNIGRPDLEQGVET
jgi:hypothetical protein